MFQFPGFALILLCIQRISPSFRTRKTENRIQSSHLYSVLCLPYSGSGFPHSEIPGSKPVRGSPRLIAAYHVLHRLSAPRHPPDTLLALDYARNQKTDARDTFYTPNASVFQFEKTSFASNTSGIFAVRLRSRLVL